MLDANFWKKYFKYYDVLNLLIPYRDLLYCIVKELNIKPGEKVLEAGCGSGNLALLIKKAGAEVTGLDSSKEALEILKKKDESVSIILADLTVRLPFDDNYFDKIASNNTLYTLPEEKLYSVLLELKRVLKPSGKIIISNLKKGWNPFEIYLNGIKKNLIDEGVVETVLLILRMVIPTIKILYYNLLIQKESGFHFFEIDEQRKILIKLDFKNVSEPRLIYSNQAILNTAIK